MARRKVISAKKPSNKKRNQTKTPGLEKRLFSKIKQEYHDIDYVDKLSDAEKKFMSTFMEEWLGARLNHSGKKMHRKKAERKRVFDMNNARQRDIYSLSKAQGMLEVPEQILEGTYNPEDDLIELLDEAKQTELFHSKYNGSNES